MTVDDKVKDITPLENRNAIQVLTDVAKTDPEDVLVIYVDQDGYAAIQSNGLPLERVNMLLDDVKLSILLG